jgi:phage recombination protein Bet
MATHELATIQDSFTFIPAGETKAITLTASIITRFVSNPTKSGKQPSEKDVMQFMMLCQARALNPFVGDAYLVGYDSQDGPNFSLITAKSALDKRAESNPAFDGMESGLVILKNGNEIERREGSILLHGEEILGAWSIVYRKDRERPTKHDVNFRSYDTGRSKWKSDPAGMIIKVAEAGGLRKAFPNTFAGLYVAEESDVTHHLAEAEVTVSETRADPVKALPGGFQRKEKPAPPIEQDEPDRNPDPAPEKESVKESPPKPAAKAAPKEKAAPPAAPKEKAAPPESAPQLSAAHQELKGLMLKHNLTTDDICRAAKGFFQIDVDLPSKIPEKNVQTMITSWDDVLEFLKN